MEILIDQKTQVGQAKTDVTVKPKQDVVAYFAQSFDDI